MNAPLPLEPQVEHGYDVGLFDLDPDLGQLLPSHRHEAARARLRVRLRRLPVGPWDARALQVVEAGHLGLLVVDGILVRELLTSSAIATELIGPGEFLRPWRLTDVPSLLEAEVRWNVLSDTTVALLDRRLAEELSSFPEVLSVLIERMSRRTARLAMAQAISQLHRVEDRVAALLWHLAERWGRVTPEGVTLPLALSHRMLAQLIGARRPTVSTALSALAARGDIRRRADGTWVLCGSPPGRPDREASQFASPRRRFLPRDALDRAPQVTGPRLLPSPGP